LRSTGQLLFDDVLDISGEGGDGWQLRFVGITHDGTQWAPQKWRGKLYVRHGGKELVGWWVQDREWKVCWPLEGDLPQTVYDSWDILVYCQKQDASMDTLRDAYLQYIGGQTKVCCAQHRAPMVLAVKICGMCKLCSVIEEHEIRCTMKAYLCCAFENCSAAVCIHHSSCAVEGGCCLYINPTVVAHAVDGEETLMELDGGKLFEHDDVAFTRGVAKDKMKKKEQKLGIIMNTCF
jgi:hypothetical protein